MAGRGASVGRRKPAKKKKLKRLSRSGAVRGAAGKSGAAAVVRAVPRGKKPDGGAARAKAGQRAPVRKAGASSRAGRGAKKEPRKEPRRGRLERAERLRRLSPRLAIVVILAGVFLAFSFGPTLRNVSSTSSLKKKEADLRREKAVTSSLEKELGASSTLGFIEKEARKQRLVMPGETLYLVTTENRGRGKGYGAGGFRSMDDAWEYVRFLLNCGYEGDGPD